MKYKCRTSKKWFNVRTGTFLQSTHVPLCKWMYAIYLMFTNLKGMSGVRIRRELGITQKSTWFLMRRIRRAMEWTDGKYSDEVEANETYFGGKEGNKHASKKLRVGLGAVGKKAVVGLKGRKTGKVRAKVVDSTDRQTLHQFIEKNVAKGSQVYTADARSYLGVVGFDHEAVRHSVGEYVREMALTNAIEAFLAMLKRG